jgi:AcrR family transcriptional regulator
VKRRERKREATRENLFRCALQLFAERGVLATTVEDITEAADVGKGTFFNYFPSKEHVLAGFGQMQMEKARAVFEAHPHKPLHELLHRVIHALAEEPSRSPALVRSLVGAMLGSEPVRKLMRHNLRRGLRLLTSMVGHAQRRGEIRRDMPAADIARQFMQTWFGTLVLWSIYPPTPLARWLDTSLDVFWTGIAAPRRKS